jgi:hypothetical protein
MSRFETLHTSKKFGCFRPFFEKSANNSAANVSCRLDFYAAIFCFAAEISASWQH